MSMAIKLTQQQRESIPETIEAEPVEVVDDSGRRYYLVSEEMYSQIKMLMEAEEIDPSLYEFEEPHQQT